MAFRLAARCQVARDYSPVSWTQYFDEAHDVRVERKINPSKGQASEDVTTTTDSFRVYLRNFCPPYAPKREFSQAVTNIDSVHMTEAEFNQYSQYPTLVTLHGGGYSGLTWAQFTRYIEQECHCRLMSIDQRSHGDTKTSDDEQMDIDTLVEDVIQVIHSTHRICGFSETPKLVLIGHSMGGAIAIKCSYRCLESLPSLAGIVIIDVVEGTAKDALPQMMAVIQTRPIKFPSLQNAIEWSVRSGMAKNLDAARVSMPGNLLNITTGHLSIHDIDDDGDLTKVKLRDRVEKHKFHISIENLITSKSHTMTSVPPNLPLPSRVASLRRDDPESFPRAQTGQASTKTLIGSSSIEEECEEDEGCDSTAGHKLSSGAANESDDKDQMDSEGYRKPPAVDLSGYCWRTNLARTQPYWPGWFDALSEQMLNAPVQGKFLLLAGIDRLDKTLTIGQMQGKFMMKVLPKCGHAVHEDSPERVAAEIGQFLVRNKFTTLIQE